MSLGDFETLFAKIVGNTIISDLTIKPTWESFRRDPNNITILQNAGPPNDSNRTKSSAYFYCLNYMKQHFDTLLHILPTITTSTTAAILVDLGSGPGTSALALSEVITSITSSPLELQYYPVDIDLEMNKICEIFFNERYKISLNSNRYSFQNLGSFKSQTNTFTQPINSDVYFISSYLLNQNSLSDTDCNHILESMINLNKRLAPGCHLRYVFAEPAIGNALRDFVARASKFGIVLSAPQMAFPQCAYLRPDGSIRQIRNTPSKVCYSAGVL